MTDAKGAEIVEMFGGKYPRLGALTINVAHSSEHYGNLVTYLRLKGPRPPSSAAPVDITVEPDWTCSPTGFAAWFPPGGRAAPPRGSPPSGPHRLRSCDLSQLQRANCFRISELAIRSTLIDRPAKSYI